MDAAGPVEVGEDDLEVGGLLEEGGLEEDALEVLEVDLVGVVADLGDGALLFGGEGRILVRLESVDVGDDGRGVLLASAAAATATPRRRPRLSDESHWRANGRCGGRRAGQWRSRHAACMVRWGRAAGWHRRASSEAVARRAHRVAATATE